MCTCFSMGLCFLHLFVQTFSYYSTLRNCYIQLRAFVFGTYSYIVLYSLIYYQVSTPISLSSKSVFIETPNSERLTYPPRSKTRNPKESLKPGPENLNTRTENMKYLVAEIFRHASFGPGARNVWCLDRGHESAGFCGM